MKIYIAKHYWKDGKNATWECHDKIDKELFEYIKKNYHKFVLNKPSLVEQNGYYIYICYEDSQDIYDRSITNATFFISKKIIAKELCKYDYQDLELNLAGNNKIRINFFIIISFLVVGLFAVMLNIFSAQITQSQDNNSKNITMNKETKGPQPVTADLSKQRNKYEIFVKDWNKQVEEHIKNYKKNKRFKLSVSSDEKTIKSLNKLIKSFYEINEDVINETENEELQDEYTEFFDKYNSAKNITFKNDIPLEKLEKELQKIIDKKDISEIVTIILMMNNMDVFENNKKKYLRKIK